MPRPVSCCSYPGLLGSGGQCLFPAHAYVALGTSATGATASDAVAAASRTRMTNAT
jgi:hypothetical protein